MQNQQTDLIWRSGDIPVSSRFDDPYYSLENGLAETNHVFLQGNDLPNRFCDGFHIAELGFGTGLNFLAALAAFRAAKISGRLHFTSFEAFPISVQDMERALAPFSGLPTDILPDDHFPEQLSGPDFELRVIIGDARETLSAWNGMADAWFLDGFSPARNPELWQADLLNTVGKHTSFQGSFATYTAAGDVRRALENAGFAVERIPGFGRKRHMTIGRKT